jgi:protein transport protein SEC20
MRSRGKAPPQVPFTLLTYLPRTRVEFRNAQLQAKRNAEAAKRKERELLFSRSQSAERRSQSTEKLSHGDIVKNASSDVTAALRRTHQLMQAELSRSQFAHQTLGSLFLHWETVFNLLSL